MKATLALLLSTLVAANAANVALLPQKDVSNLAHQVNGSDITVANGWTIGANTTTTPSGTTLNVTTTGTSQSTLVGTNATAPAATTAWLTEVSGFFTIELNMRVNAAPNGFRMWLGNDFERIDLDIYGDRVVTTNPTTGLKTVNMNLLDGQFHTFRVVSDSAGNINKNVHVWVDGVLITDPTGAVYNSGGNENRLIFGDYTSQAFGNSFNVDIASFAYEGVAYAPIPEPTATALFGLGALGLILRRRRK